MTISDTTPKFRYEGNGSTDTFAFNARAFTAASILVEIITRATDALVETLTLDTDYSVTIATDGTASIHVTNALKIPSSLRDIQLRRNLAQTQTVRLPTGTRFPAKTVENAIDKAVAIIQDLTETVDRSFKLSPTSSLDELFIPAPSAGKALKWNDDGDEIVNSDSDFDEIVTNAGASEDAAAASAANASASATTAQNWAIKTDAAVSGGSFSSKEYAQGTQASTGGSAKNWASQSGSDVTGASSHDRSAKSWSQDNLAGATYGGSAKDWAQSASAPDGTLKSAKSYATDAAASAALVNAQALVPTFSNAGLVITIGSFSIMDASGVSVAVTGTTITCQASSTQFLVLDLGTKGFHLLDRAYHDGALVLAKVITGSSTVTTFERLWGGSGLPGTALCRTHKRMATAINTSQIRVAIIGDSLMEPAGSGTKWDALLFDTAQSASGYNVTNAANFTRTNYAIGGSTTEYGITLIGEGCYPNTGAYAETALSYAHSEGTRRFSPPKVEVGISPLLTSPPDLVIFGYGANGGTYDYGLTEFIISALRAAGSEVIIVTQNYRTDNATFLKSKGDILKKIAVEYGCALVDTWMYVLEKSRAGFTVHDDVIHMAADGHKAYAEAIRGALSPAFIMNQVGVPRLPAQCIAASYESNSNEWDRLANSCQLQFTPSSTTGTAAQSTTVTTTAKNPALLYGGKTTSNAVTSLAVGEVASFAHPWANFVSLLVDGDSTFTCDIKTQNQTTTLATGVTLASAVSGRAIVVEGVGGGAYADVTAAFRQNRGIQIVVTAGTLHLLGVIFHCDKMREMDIETEVKYTGTWSTEAWTYGHPISRVSDTDADSFVFDFEGSEAVMEFSSRTAAGKIDIYLNGKKIFAQTDLYNAGTFLKTIRIPSGGDITDYPNRRKGKNTVQVKLNGANGSVASAASANRRLGLLAINVFERG